MKTVTMEQQLDRGVKEGALSAVVMIQRELDYDEDGYVVGVRGKRKNGTKSGDPVGKIYTVRRGCELYLLQKGGTTLFLIAGNQVELNMTLHNSRVTGVTVVRTNLNKTDPNRILSTTAESFNACVPRILPTK